MQTDLYVIKKTIFGITYWWNENEMRWEGLRDNMTLLTQEEFDIRFKQLRDSCNNGYREITFNKF